MSVPLRKVLKTEPLEPMAAKGLLYHDWSALTPCQRECSTRLGMTIQMEQEAYLSQHPEVGALLQLFVSKMSTGMKRKSDLLKETAEFFLRDPDELDKEIRNRLNVPPEGPYLKSAKSVYRFQDLTLENDLKNITVKHYPPEPWTVPIPDVVTPDTISSSYLTLDTSESTLPTPEPIPTPVPTLTETMFALVSNTVDKAIFLHVDDQALRYDTAYVELTKAVEECMEIPIIDIREDICQLFYNAYNMFEINIMEKERIAAEIAWEKRMRKKLKRTLRRQKNFKGYETPTSDISSHDSYKIAPPRPCKCHPQWNYNRYAKDRFGIYLPREDEYMDNNITVTPAISAEDIEGGEIADNKTNSKKSGISTKSTQSEAY